MPNTTNFNWATPADTDLVKDGAAAIRTLGSSIDTSFVDLKGGTTGQVLSKASNTDLDYSWVTTDDANAIQNAIVDAKGDLIAASANDTPARLAVGNNGETLVANSAAATGLSYKEDYAAGKNKIINGDFTVNQRSFSSITTDATYGFDRWRCDLNDGTVTFSPQTFTPGTAPVAGYEGINFQRCVTSGQTAAGAYASTQQRIENVRTFAGQTVTISFWAKAASGTPAVSIELRQNFGSGGSTTVNVNAGKVTLSTSWARYSATVAVPSVSGKTIGASSFLALQLWFSAGTDFNARTTSLGIQSNTFDIWGVQVEAGSVATAFQTATGTLQGELAACQRYYYRTSNNGAYTIISFGGASSTTSADMVIGLPATMRINPSSVDFSTIALQPIGGGSITAITSVSVLSGTQSNAAVATGVASGLSSGAVYRLLTNNSTSGYIGFSAEL